MGRLFFVLAAAFVFGPISHAANPDVDTYALSLLKPLSGVWVVKSMNCAASGVDIMAKNKEAGAVKKIQISAESIAEITTLPGAIEYSKPYFDRLKLQASSFGNDGNTTTLEFSVGWGSVSCRSRKNPEQGCSLDDFNGSGTFQDILSLANTTLYYIRPSASDADEKIVLSSPDELEKNGWCMPNDLVVTTLARESMQTGSLDSEPGIQLVGWRVISHDHGVTYDPPVLQRKSRGITEQYTASPAARHLRKPCKLVSRDGNVIYDPPIVRCKRGNVIEERSGSQLLPGLPF